MTPQYTYDVGVEWTGDRRGTLRSPGLASLDVAAPPEFKGPPGEWTPEHLFVGSVVSCFMTTFTAIAELSKLEVVAFSVDATGTLEKLESIGYQMTSVELRARVTIARPEDVERTERILAKAEQVCLITNSIVTRVELRAHVTVGELAPA